MFKHAAIKKYGNKLLPCLQKRYGKQLYYSGKQIRTTVYHCSFTPSHLPLGYILFLEPKQLSELIHKEFPNLCINSYKQEMRDYLNERKYHGYLRLLAV